MIQSLDTEAQRLGVPRQAVINVWIAERLRVDAHALNRSNPSAQTTRLLAACLASKPEDETGAGGRTFGEPLIGYRFYFRPAGQRP